MTEVPSQDDRYSVTFVNRRRVLLAVGGIVLTSFPAARLDPAHSAEAPARHHVPAKHRHEAHHVDPAYEVPSYPLNQPLYYINDASKAIALTIEAAGEQGEQGDEGGAPAAGMAGFSLGSGWEKGTERSRRTTGGAMRVPPCPRTPKWPLPTAAAG